MSWKELAQTQPYVVQMLTSSLKKERLAHAYLFEGSRGTGKKRVALQLAKSFFCGKKEGVEPCQICPDCKRIDHGNHPDLHLIEPDGQSIKKQQVEHLQKEFTYRGVESSKKVYLIDQADKMTASAANSLLKFLEEPGAPTLALLLTEQVQHMLSTVLSRSQILTFSPLPREAFIKILTNEGISLPISSLLSSLTTSYEEAMGLAEGEWIAQARNVVIQLVEELHSRQNQVMFTLQEKWFPHFKERKEQELGLDLLLLWYRDLLYTQVGKDDALTYLDQKETLSQQVLSSSQSRISESMSAIMEAKRYLSANVHPQLLMEKLMLRLQEG
ncbi:DNA polymerase III subunit delta' [Halalkalibacterium ligniniphilum]|uniref:DNA polymerase III subunit delta' n=1 Tax=Halalkalibacterium ligniniphilum TaxID=1134413 RepID=UPI00034DCB5C|nr:DNA polymerase III subunit delta' [Halalkalibacterium ligniniphilum]